MLRPRRILANLVLTALALRIAYAGEPPTARIMVNPVPAKVGPPYPPLADGGPNIVGNELRLDAGGVRVWVEVQFEDWDPNSDGSPGANYFQVALDGAGLLDADIDGDGNVTNDGDQDDIILAHVPCMTDADCGAAFGESYPEQCDAPFDPICHAVYPDKDGIRQDGWCAGGCSCGSHAAITQSGWTAFGCYVGNYRPDDDSIRWGATAVYDVPHGARGKYVIRLDQDDTFLAHGLDNIESLSETGFTINVLTGRCCFQFGTPAEDCVDTVTRTECGDDEPGPVVFTPEQRCPPDGPACSGACCDTLHGVCDSPVPQTSCDDAQSAWTPDVACDDVACLADTGACCDHDPFEPCRQSVLSDCQCTRCTWHKLQPCGGLDCPATSIPTVSTWGLAILSLALMTAAKIRFGKLWRC